MRELMPITLICISFAILAKYNSSFDYYRRISVKKDIFFYCCIAIALIIFSGLRTYYNDTQTYKYMYDYMDMNDRYWQEFDWRLGNNPGYWLLNALMKSMGFSTQSYLLGYAVITIVIFVWFIREYSCAPGMSMFLFFTMGVLSFVIAAMKQGIAIAFCLLATHYAIKKRWGRFAFFLTIATTFHVYSLMYIVVPFLFFKPWTGRTYLILAVFMAVGLLLEQLLGTLIDITTMFGEEYDISTLVGEGVNPFRLAVHSVPALLSFVVSRHLQQHNSRVHNLIVNLAMLNSAIMFVAMFGQPVYFGRLANYFLIFQILAMPYLFTFFEEQSKMFLSSIAVFCYSFYYWYDYHSFFDIEFSRITLWQYLQLLS